MEQVSQAKEIVSAEVEALRALQASKEHMLLLLEELEKSEAQRPVAFPSTSSSPQIQEELWNLKRKLQMRDATIVEQGELIDALQNKLETADETIGALARLVQDSNEELKSRMDATMALLKGEVITLDRAGSEAIARTINMLERGGVERDREHNFKTAHTVVKTAVIELLGEVKPGEVWNLSEDLIRRIPVHQHATVFKRLQELVIAYDNMSDEAKRAMTTSQEVVANAKWLLAIARHCKSSHRVKDRTPGVINRAPHRAHDNGKIARRNDQEFVKKSTTLNRKLSHRPSVDHLVSQGILLPGAGHLDPEIQVAHASNHRMSIQHFLKDQLTRRPSLQQLLERHIVVDR